MDIDTILTAVRSPDNAARREAEQRLVDASQDPMFLYALAAEIAAEDKDQNNRLLAGVVFKNSVRFNGPEEKQQKLNTWTQVPEDVRAEIKSLIVSALGSEVKQGGHAAATALARVALLEYPQLWPDLIEGLVSSITDGGTTNKNLKLSSIETLGFICESIEEDLLSEKSTDILRAIVLHGMSDEWEQDPRVKSTAASALLNALEFVEPNMKIDEDRSYLMNTVIQCCAHSDENVAVKAFQCLVEVVHLYYEHLADFMGLIFELTLSAMHSPDVPERVCMQAIEFWTSVCDKEMDLIADEEEATANDEVVERKCQNFIQQALEPLSGAMLELLLQQDEFEDDDTWNKATAAQRCLRNMTHIVTDNIVERVMPFVQNNIVSENWHHREAATMAFGCILDGPTVSIRPFIESGFGVLIDHLGDPEEPVMDSTAWVIGDIAKLHPSCVRPFLSDIVQRLSHLCVHETPRVANRAAWALHHVARANPEGDMPETAMTPFFEALIGLLFNAIDREDAIENNLRINAFEAINSIVTNAGAASLEQILAMVPILLQRLETAFNMPVTGIDDSLEKEEVMAHLLGALMNIIVKIHARIEGYAQPIVEVFLFCFRSEFPASVVEEALLGVGALAGALDSKFEYFVDPMMQFVVQFIGQPDDYQICAVALGVVGDFCRVLGPTITQYTDAVMPLVFNALVKMDLNQNLYRPLLQCIADVAMSIGGAFEAYFEQSMEAIGHATRVGITDPDEYEQVEFLNSVRCGILEAYTGIAMGLEQDKKHHLFLPYCEAVVHFIEEVWGDMSMTEEVSRSACGMLGDMATFHGTTVRGILQTPKIEQILDEGMQMMDENTIRVATWAKETIAAL